jgi:branched-chain amino acid transport system ATP-binding protein
VTVLLVGQNIQEVLQISRYGYVMETGRIRLQGTSEELMDNPMVREAYLG